MYSSIFKRNISKTKERQFRQLLTLNGIILKEPKLWIYRDRCQKQVVITSVLYCNILKQGLSNFFFPFLNLN